MSCVLGRYFLDAQISFSVLLDARNELYAKNYTGRSGTVDSGEFNPRFCVLFQFISRCFNFVYVYTRILSQLRGGAHVVSSL